jgi:hypothetical protein
MHHSYCLRVQKHLHPRPTTAAAREEEEEETLTLVIQSLHLDLAAESS